jgi:thymidine phosphorylase
LHKKAGDGVRVGEPIATLYASNTERLENAKKVFLSAITYAENAPKMQALIYKTVI